MYKYLFEKNLKYIISYLIILLNITFFQELVSLTIITWKFLFNILLKGLLSKF